MLSGVMTNKAQGLRELQPNSPGHFCLHFAGSIAIINTWEFKSPFATFRVP